MTKILHVRTSTFEAQATFEKDRRGNWKCVKAAPDLDWMPLADIGFVKLWLEQNGHAYRWEAVTPEPQAPEAAHAPEASSA